MTTKANNEDVNVTNGRVASVDLGIHTSWLIWFKDLI
ncbi:hypothetical protein L195_g061713, partial [Trifolium pratense]